MVKSYSLLLVFCFTSFVAKAQQWQQYFDGADTSAWSSLLIEIDTTGGNTWQVGPPQKTYFNAPASVPNVIVTDTINGYPANDTSSFYFKVPVWTNWGIFALQWKQKVDLDSAIDVGTISYSADGGVTWNEVFGDPYLYNFYGYDSVNVDTVANGMYGFTGTDTVWKDIWLCYQMSWLQQFSMNDTLLFRFTITSDSLHSNREGWMIDNMICHLTIVHTAKGEQKDEYQKVYPSVTSGVVHIETAALQEFHIIENMQLIDATGRVVKEWKNVPTRFWIDIGDQPDGSYFLKVQTNKQVNTYPVILQR
jgi:hypothetical protein